MIQERARLLVFSILLTGRGAITGCTRSSEPPADPRNLVTVYKSASCGCCTAWVKYLRQAGFSVDAHELGNLGLIKERVGVPVGMGSCHTAEAGGYFLECRRAHPAWKSLRARSSRSTCFWFRKTGRPRSMPTTAAKGYDAGSADRSHHPAREIARRMFKGLGSGAADP